MSFPRYPKYKESGVEWLGEVPEHWTMPPLYLRYEVMLGKMLDTKKLTGAHAVPYVRNVDVQWDSVNVSDLPDIDIAPTERDRFTLRAGDMLVCEGGEVGRAAIWQSELDPCAFQKAIHRLRPLTPNEDPRYLFHCLRLASETGVFIAHGNPNTIPHLTGEAFRLYRLPSPPRREQSVIAAFLDRETAKIDQLVEEQRGLIALLQEKRQAVISHAVTKGLDPAVPMNPSGIEWLGDVPAHWRLMPLGRIAISRCDGPFGSGLKSEHYTESGVRVIRLQNIRRDGFDGSDEAFIDADYYARELNGHDVVGGDVVIAGLGDEKNTVGRACVAPAGIEPAMVKADCFRFRLAETQVLADFVAMALSAGAAADAGVLSSGSTRSRIPLSVMATRRLAIPPIDVQREITEFIRVEASKLDTLTTEAQHAIDLLLERRAALISAAVTGQIDVRNLEIAH